MIIPRRQMIARGWRCSPAWAYSDSLKTTEKMKFPDTLSYVNSKYRMFIIYDFPGFLLLAFTFLLGHGRHCMVRHFPSFFLNGHRPGNGSGFPGRTEIT